MYKKKSLKFLGNFKVIANKHNLENSVYKTRDQYNNVFFGLTLPLDVVPFIKL